MDAKGGKNFQKAAEKRKSSSTESTESRQMAIPALWPAIPSNRRTGRNLIQSKNVTGNSVEKLGCGTEEEEQKKSKKKPIAQKGTKGRDFYQL